ncbi:MAG: S-methyl-5'-thioadenosine phosphorylase [Candidatus Aenigmatarchaeota archaeon]|nr:MAG: S-methyl-5'-thioadenosine phosphorylase [Candidatus Aenigmarchaeota archaeon]
MKKTRKKQVKTPYGRTSSPVFLGKISGKPVAFIPRHGMQHKIPPHKVPYLANIYALKKLGVERIISVNAVGSLKNRIKPGDFVINDQFINFTRRKDTFYDNRVIHISPADPYCPELRKAAERTLKKLGYRFHPKGTIAVIEGPRFSTRAESRFFSRYADVINMTQYPEVVLARELEICFLGISLVTDYDVGAPGWKPVNIEEVLRVFKENEERVKRFIFELLPEIPEKRSCPCSVALKDAILS